jgi:hypothetical protein
MTPNLRPAFQPTGRQLLFQQLLARENPELGELYECALRAFQDDANPRRIFLAALSIRELMKDLPKSFDVPLLVEPGRMGDRLDDLERSWTAALGSGCCQSGAWTGQIDDRLRRLLMKLLEFFKWRSESSPKMRDRAAALFQRLDPAGLPLPQPLEKQRAAHWITLHDYFNAATHRSRTTDAEFSAKLEEFEQLLTASLNPTPSEDFSAIDAILQEEVTDAQA